MLQAFFERLADWLDPPHPIPKGLRGAFFEYTHGGLLRMNAAGVVEMVEAQQSELYEQHKAAEALDLQRLGAGEYAERVRNAQKLLMDWLDEHEDFFTEYLNRNPLPPATRAEKIADTLRRIADWLSKRYIARYDRKSAAFVSERNKALNFECIQDTYRHTERLDRKIARLERRRAAFDKKYPELARPTSQKRRDRRRLGATASRELGLQHGLRTS